MKDHVPERAVLLWRNPAVTAEEWIWGRRLCEELLRRSASAAAVLVIDTENPLSVGEVLAKTSASSLGIVLDDKALWGPRGWESLQEILDHQPQIALVAPVSNEALVSQQRMAPPFLYSTPSLLESAGQEHFQRYRQQWCEVAAVDPFAFLLRRSDLSQLASSLPLTHVPEVLVQQGKRLALALDTYVHRYAPVYEQLRPDMQNCVPLDAHSILDVGCAAGAFGAVLKQRQECQVTGIELDTTLAETAKTRLDRVLIANVELLPVTTFTQEFDCITCGDILEHLRNPWAMVEKLVAWLRPGGRLIATTPNIGHWSIVADLLRGRWDIVPFSLLSWEHLRFFTRAGIEQLFRGCGCTLELLHGMKAELPAIGGTFLQQVSALGPEVDLDSLRTHEFLIVARKD